MIKRAIMPAIGTEYLRSRRDNKAIGLPIGVRSIDKDYVPSQAGDIITVIGRPGNGKTSFMVRWARTRAEWLVQNSVENRIVIYVTLEQSIEALYAFDVAASSGVSVTSMARGEITDEQLGSTIERGMSHVTRPLWFIGHSQERRKKRPVINVETIAAALREIEAWADTKYVIDCVFVDYLQRMPYTTDSKVIGLDLVLNDLKDWAFEFGCPFVIGVQAKREVDARPVPVPMMEDGQWTSAIEQVSDASFSVTRPRKYRQEGEMFGGKNPVMVEGENQMLIYLLKQKLGPANIPYWVSFNPIYNRLDEMELRDIDMNGVPVGAK